MKGTMRALNLLWLLVVLSPATASAQADPRLLGRWVGTHQSRPLHLDFYGDSMLVVNDHHALYYRATRDSLYAVGDTSFAVEYWFALDRLLLETVEGNVITMATQDKLARPLEGRWLGTPTLGDERIELVMRRGGIAEWRQLPGGAWIGGEWDRHTRLITFTWLPDSTQWSGQYDPANNTLLFEQTYEGSGTVFLRRVFRW